MRITTSSSSALWQLFDRDIAPMSCFFLSKKKKKLGSGTNLVESTFSRVTPAVLAPKGSRIFYDSTASAKLIKLVLAGQPPSPSFLLRVPPQEDTARGNHVPPRVHFFAQTRNGSQLTYIRWKLTALHRKSRSRNLVVGIRRVAGGGGGQPFWFWFASAIRAS